jgi:hypothetical protein
VPQVYEALAGPRDRAVRISLMPLRASTLLDFALIALTPASGDSDA